MNRIHFLISGFLFISLQVIADPGTIEGTVLDYETGSPLSGADVILEKTPYGASADETGKYVIRNVPAGIYAVKASMMGYSQETASEIRVETNRVAQVMFELKERVLDTEAISISESCFNKAGDAVSNTHTFSSSEIRSSPGSAGDVFRILKNIPGVSTTGTRSANLIVRGGDPNENLTLLDNIEIRSPLHFSREDMSMGVISIIDPAIIKNVEFLTGGFPAEYGDKLSSVFDLKVKEGNRSQFNHDLNLSMAGFNAYIDGPLPAKGSMILSIRRGIFDLFTKMMGRAVQPRYWDMLGKVSYDLNPRHQVSFVGFYYKDDAERREKMEDHGPLARKYEFMNWNDSGMAAGFNWRYLYSEKGYAVTTLEWTGNGNESLIGKLNRRELNGDDNFYQNLQLKTKISYKISPRLILKTGGYLKKVSSDYTRWREADTLRTGMIIPAFIRNFELPDSYQSGVFIQGIIRPLGRLAVHAGLRRDSYTLTDESTWSPRFGVIYHLTENLTLNGSAGIYYQTPSPLYLSEDDVNLNLKSSKADHTIFGIEQLLAVDTRLCVELYFKEMDRSFVDNDTTRIITNDGSGYSKGMEVTIQKKMNRNFLASAAYTWSISKRQDMRDLPEYDSNYDRRHNLTFMSDYQMSNKWRLGMKFQFASGNPCTPVSGSVIKYGEAFVVEGAENSSRYPDYYSLDIRMERIFRFPRWTLNFYLEVWNVLNHENVLDYYYDIKDNGQVIQNVVADFPVMPMIGFSAQF